MRRFYFLMIFMLVFILHQNPQQVQAQDEEKPSQLTAEQVKFYIDKVQPILLNNCYACHGPGSSVKGNLFLGNRKDILSGGDSGAAAIPGNAEESLIIQALNFDGFEMPPKGKLPQDQIDTIAKWINDGLPIPPDQEQARPEQHASPYKTEVNEETKGFWHHQRVQAPKIPKDTQVAFRLVVVGERCSSEASHRVRR